MEETTRSNSIDIRDSCLPGLASDSLDYVHDAMSPPRKTSGLSLLPGVPSPQTVANTIDLTLNTTGISLNTRPTSPFALSSTDGSLRKCSLRTVTGTGTGEESQSGPELGLKQKNTFSDEKVEIGDYVKKPSEDTSSDELEKRDEEADDNKSMGSDSYTTATSSLSNSIFCKICHCGNEEEEPTLITPCLCSGSLKYVHQECLQRWIKSSDIKRCELCKFPFTMQSKVKPFAEWEKLDMSSLERRKLCCSVTFHAVAITCVIWSLYVLIDRTTEEIQSGELQWPFWTKLVVVAIGFTGGLVFMYIQCKVYIQLCRKWKAFNRTIVVQDMPPDILKQQKKAILDARKPGLEETILQMESTSPQRDSVVPIGRRSSGGVVDARSNVETQTALRGISIASALREETLTDTTSSRVSDISIPTISRLLELMEGGSKNGGITTVPTVIFFTDSELRKQRMSSQGSHFSRTRSALTEPLLICDLPGNSISLANCGRSEDQPNGLQDEFLEQEEGERTFDSLDGRVDGPDLSLDVDIMRTNLASDDTKIDLSATNTRDAENYARSNKEMFNEKVDVNLDIDV